MRISTRAMRWPRCWLSFLTGDGDRSPGSSWGTQGTRRCWQPMQVASPGDASMQRILRRLHSQQDLVPLRTFLRLRLAEKSIPWPGDDSDTAAADSSLRGSSTGCGITEMSEGAACVVILCATAEKLRV